WVQVSVENVLAFLKDRTRSWKVSEDDRWSQVSELTFDASVPDVFLCWGSGGCLCVPSDMESLVLNKYISKHSLTMWHSVPSYIALMERGGMLSPGAYPSLRFSCFGGEALPQRLVELWSAAAPNSEIRNVYGPTEVTSHCLDYTWNKS